MGNDRIEKILYDAQEKLPTTNLEWGISEIVEKDSKNKKFHINKVVAACLTFVLFLGIGGITVLANLEMDINPQEYGQWPDYLNCGGWKKCGKLMKKRGFVVPESFENYEFTACDAWLVAKYGDTYWDALVKNVYNPISISYGLVSSNQTDGESKISVDVGSVDEVYWSSYYGYENVDGVWIQPESEEVFEYNHYLVYGDMVNYRLLGDTIIWRWIDEENGICWGVTVPMNTGIDSIDVVKIIIDLNK